MSRKDQNIKQPRALTYLAATELWERVGFYTVQGMLVFLISNYFKMDDKSAVLLTGTYGALVFITPIIGGYVADKLLGFWWTVLMGAVFMCFGYFMISTLKLNIVYWGLATVVLGNGFLKPNLASFLGVFYTENDIRRQSGFTYYYMIANLGSVLATIIAGYIHQSFSWHIVFLVPAFGLMIAIITFFIGTPSFHGQGKIVATQFIQNKKPLFALLLLCLWFGISGCAYLLLKNAKLGDTIVIVIGVLTVVFLIYRALQYHHFQRKHFFALVLLILFSVVFWALFFEVFSAVSLFTERNVNRVLWGHSIPPVVFVSLESIFIVVIGAPFAALWKYLGRINKDPNIAIKFGLALFATAISMWVLNFGIRHPNAQGLVFPEWLILFYFLLTVGDLLLSPNLISAVTALAPEDAVGMMMGVQYMAIGFGSSITGVLAQFAAIPKGLTNLKTIAGIYAHAFDLYALIALCAGVIICLISPWIKALMRQPSQTTNPS